MQCVVLHFCILGGSFNQQLDTSTAMLTLVSLGLSCMCQLQPGVLEALQFLWFVESPRGLVFGVFVLGD